MKKRIRNLIKLFIYSTSLFVVDVIYGDIWNLRKALKNGGRLYRLRLKCYNSYFEHFGSYIGVGADISSPPVFPHGYFGIFISNNAKIGENVVVFQHVTIGSNTAIGSKGIGAPELGNNVYIGSGAKIIGNVRIGNNARIGANCIVVKDVPDNSVTILRGTESIMKDVVLNNKYVSVAEPLF